MGIKEICLGAALALGIASSSNARSIHAQEQLLNGIRETVYDSYKNIKSGKKGKNLIEIIEEIVVLANKHCDKEVNTINEVNQSCFEKQGKYLFIGNFRSRFGSNTNVILADLVKKESKSIKINGKEITYQSILLENPTIDSLKSYLSEGENDYSTWTMGNKVFHNIETLIAVGKGVWNILNGGSSAWGDTHYKLVKAEWQDEYKKSLILNKNKEEAKEVFARECAHQIAEEATLHEIYHQIVKWTKEDTNDADEDVRANYFKYIHGKLGPGNLTDFFKGLQYPKDSYDRKVTEIMIQDFVGYIRDRIRRGEFENILVEGNSFEEQMHDFHKLTKLEIGGIAKDLYERTR